MTLSQNTPDKVKSVLAAESDNIAYSVLMRHLMDFDFINLAAIAPDTIDVIYHLSMKQVDVLLLNVNLPGLKLKEFIIFLGKKYPQLRVILFNDVYHLLPKIEKAINSGFSDDLTGDSATKQILSEISTWNSNQESYNNKIMAFN
jgi:hypothetical protein